MAKNINILFFNFGEGTRFTDGILSQYKNNEDFTHAFVEYQEDAVDYLREWPNAIIFLRVTNKPSLQESLSLLKICKKGVRDNVFKFAAFNEIAKPDIEPVLRKFGVSEVLEASIRAKTLKFKIDFWSKTLKSRFEDKNDDTTTVKGQKSKQDEGYGTGPKVEFTEALELESDCWILGHKNDCKKVLRRWLIKLIGPGPAAGHWSEVENKNDSKSTYWRFIPHADWDDFIHDEGHWYFCGTKPEFDHNEKKWNFSGDFPALFFKSGDEYHYRFKFDAGVLKVATTSDFAEAMRDEIERSFSEEVDIKGDEEMAYKDHTIETDNDGGSHMKGDIGEEEEVEREGKKRKALRGDKKRKRPEFDGEMDEDGEFAPADKTGPGEEVDEDGENHEFSDEDLGGHLKGKTKFKKKNGSELSGEFEGEEDEEGEDKRHKNAADDLGGPLSGKGKTDKKDGGPLSGELEGSEDDEGEDKRHKNAADDLGGPLAGKGKTDKKDGGPLSGELEGLDDDIQEDKKHSNKADDLGGPLSGELEGLDEDVKEDKKHGNKADDLGGPLKGKIGEEDKANELDEEGVEEKEIFGGKKSFFREGDPEQEEGESDADYEKRVKKARAKKAADEAKQAELDALEASIFKDRSDKSSTLEKEKNEKGSSLLDKFAKEDDPEQEELDEDGQPKRRKLKGLSGGDILQEYNEDGTLKTNDDGSLNMQAVDEIVTADGEKVSLESGEVKVVVINNSDDKFQHHLCIFEDLTDEEVVVRGGENVVSESQTAEVMLTFQYAGQKVQVKIQAETIEALDYSEDEYMYTFEIKEVEKKKLTQFMKLYRERQENISKFIKTARGIA